MLKFKALSSGWLHRTVPEARDFAWQNGYAAFSVSESQKAQVSRYIASQAEHHKTMTFEEEIAELLQRHGIDEYDPRYVWD